MIKKMLQTWLSNLIQKNPVSGKSLMIKDKDEDTQDISSNDDEFKNKKMVARIFVDELLEYFEFVDKLKYRILPMQQMYGDSFVEVINLRDFNLSSKKNNTVMDNFDVDGFIGESVLYNHKDSTKLSNRKKNISTGKLKYLEKKVESGNYTIDEICTDISEILVDGTYDQSDILISEMYAESQQPGSKEILIREKSDSKNLDSPECFYEYVLNNSGEFKPFLKFRKNENTTSPTPKKRGRPSKKQPILTEDEDDVVKFAKRMGIQTELDMSNVLILVHKPQNIVILETNYGSKLGYVEVANSDNVENFNVQQQLSTIIGRITSVSNNTTNSQDEILSKVVKLIVKKVIEQSTRKKKNSEKYDVDKILNSINPDVFNAIKKLVIETDKENPRKNIYRKLKARFIPLERMFQFTIPSPDYAPYGLSFIDPLVLQGKLYILNQLSNTIMKLSRAAPIRKWIIDVGATQGHAKYVEQLKREMYNKKVTIDNILSFKSMPQILSDFKE